MRTVEAIYEALRAACEERCGCVIGDSCDIAVRLYAAAAQIQALEVQAEWVARQSFPQTAEGEMLDRHAEMRGITRLGAERAEALAEQYWPLLVLTRRGCGELGDTAALCRVLLVPGDCTAPLERITAETVVTYGLSSRDSLTLSSLAEPVLCVQRQLPRPGGGVVEPQEFPLPELPAPAAELLPLLGLRLLQLPQTSAPFVW